MTNRYDETIACINLDNGRAGASEQDDQSTKGFVRVESRYHGSNLLAVVAIIYNQHGESTDEKVIWESDQA